MSLPSPLLILVALLYFILTYAFAGTLMASLGVVTTSQREAGQITFIFVMPFVAPLWFLTALLENPGGTIAQVLSYVPFSAPVATLIRLALDAMSPLDIVISLGVLGASVAFAVFLATLLFRTFLLMYGQRPKIKLIARAIVFG
jgi:ABC-2 type transport system permease protein